MATSVKETWIIEPECRMQVLVDENGVGKINSDLLVRWLGNEAYLNSDENNTLVVAANVIESLVLAHACQGVDVGSTEYVTGLGTAIEALGNQYDEVTTLSDFDLNAICVAYEQGVGKASLDQDKPNPYKEGTDCFRAYALGLENPVNLSLTA